LSWYGRLKGELIKFENSILWLSISSPLGQIDPGVRINADEDCEQESCCDCCNHHERQTEESTVAEASRCTGVVIVNSAAVQQLGQIYWNQNSASKN
jgi:hypothetical protein